MSQVVEVGQVLAGKYRVEKVLGQGGMGVVVAATHLQLNQLFALKFLLPHMCQHGEAVARFSREARAAVQIQSEHVARVSDVGTLETGAPYMVMEYLNGSDLSDVVRQRGPLPIHEAVGFVLQACEAIAEAHALGIVHRDLKPANLFLTQRRDGSPLVKVLDFGISKALQDTLTSPSVTSTSAVMGSPLYMSPEQVRSTKNVDARSDVWALGIILQELLTGAPTYEAETASALMAMIAADPPMPLRQRRPDAPAPLEAAILRCLVKNRDQRMPNVAELARALAPFAAPEARGSVERISRVLGDAGYPVSAGAAASGHFSAASAPSNGGATAGAWGQTQSRSRSKVGAIVAVLMLLSVAAVGVSALLFWQARARRVAAQAPEASTPIVSTAAVAPAASGVLPIPAPTEKLEVPTPVAAAPSASAPASSAAATNKAAVPSKPKSGAARSATPTPRRGAQNSDLFDDNK